MARIYVGTYRKYNNGSLAGGWLDLADYKDYDAFLAACQKLHKDEREPEYLIEDSEGFPDGLDCLEWIYEEDFDDVKKAMQEEANDTPAATPAPTVSIVNYSEKSFAVVGDTKPIKDDLKKLGGCFNGRLSCGAGWIFSNKKRAAVDAFLSTCNSASATAANNASASNASADAKLFGDWLAEYNGDGKYYAGAVKMHDAFVLIEKPSIENKFCFHDEGPDYDLYRSLIADDAKMAEYFKSEKLHQFDWKIAHMENGEEYTKDRRVWWYVDEYNKASKRLYLCFSASSVEPNYTLCNDEERALILRALKYGRMLFEKRLDTYLKKYGVSKLHTWTYWADA